MDPTAKRNLGRTGVELTQLGFGGARHRRPVRSGERSRCRGDPAGGLGSRHPLFRHRALVWSRPERAPHRPLPLPAAAPRVRPVDQGRPRADARRATPDRFDPTGWAGGLPFEHRFDYSYDGDHARLRGQPAAARHAAHRPGADPRSRFLVSRDRAEGARPTWPSSFTERLAGARPNSSGTASSAASGPASTRLGMMPRFLDLVDIDFFLVALRYTLMEQETLETELPALRRAGRRRSSSAGCSTRASWPRARYPGRNTIMPNATPEAIDKVRQHRGGLQADTTCRWQPPPCSSRSGTQP